MGMNKTATYVCPRLSVLPIVSHVRLVTSRHDTTVHLVGVGVCVCVCVFIRL